MKVSRITKIAGLSVVGFCVTAAAADKINLNPMAAQIAGFVGAFVGTLVGGRRRRTVSPAVPADAADNGKDETAAAANR
jgi:hypothetical protein